MEDQAQILAETGMLLFGHDWQRPTARALGAFHPNGPRDTIDDRLVRRWATGARPIPDWAVAALISLLEASASKIDTMKVRWKQLCPTS